MNLANAAISIVSNNTEVDSFLLMEGDTFKLKLIDHIKNNSELNQITSDLIDYANNNY